MTRTLAFCLVSASTAGTVATAGGGQPLVGRRPRPQHPGGEDAVEQGLHQGRVEEARALLALEAHPEGLFERGAHCGEGGRVPPAASTRASPSRA